MNSEIRDDSDFRNQGQSGVWESESIRTTGIGITEKARNTRADEAGRGYSMAAGILSETEGVSQR